MKRIISSLLVIVLCLMISVSASAVGSSEIGPRENSFVAAVESKVEDVLVAIELQKEDFGMGHVDFSNLALGKEIPSYELTNSGLVPIDDIHYFPILSEDSWVATAVVSYSAYGDMNVEVSAKYADDYLTLSRNDALRTSGTAGNIALVFDSTKAYLYSDYDNILVESFKEIPGRENVATYVGEIAPVTAQVATHCTIDIQPVASAQTSRQVYSTQDETFVSLDITPITQPTDYTCWAASSAMLLNYRGESEDVSSVVDAANVNLNTYRSAAQCSYLIGNEYGYPCGVCGLSSGYYYSLTLNDLINELYLLSSPLFAGFSSSEIGHAVVVKGYVNVSGYPTMTFIDPADGYIKAATIPDNGAVTITYGGGSHGLAAAFAVYEASDN